MQQLMFDQAFTGDTKLASKLDKEEFSSLFSAAWRLGKKCWLKFNTGLWQGKQHTVVIWWLRALLLFIISRNSNSACS